MQTVEVRTLTIQLAEDLGWLEQHCRRRPDQVVHAAALRLAAAIVRNCIAPSLDGQPAAPLHVAVVGGAGTGKSTVVNMLTGTIAAEANPQAGFTRHPIAYTSVNGQLAWPPQLGFLGGLQRLNQPVPSNLDEDVYQVRRVPSDRGAGSFLGKIVVWDCPDMTTWAASSYIPRLLEIAGLADLLIYVASDERYNDEIPTQFLQLLLQSGKPVICCLMKMREQNVDALVAHFREEVLGRLPGGAVATIAIPYLTPAQLADPANQAAKFRIPLLNQVSVLAEPPEAARERSVRGGIHFLDNAHDSLLALARDDVEALEGWEKLVHRGQEEFDGRYRREHLTGDRFRGFDEALVRLLELLEFPGVGKVVSKTLWVMRTPYRLIRGWVDKAIERPAARSIPEKPILEGAFSAWLDMLRKEALHHGANHPLWSHLQEGFEGELPIQARERFEECFRSFQASMADEIDRTARAIYGELEQSPAMLNAFRTGKLGLDLASIGTALVVGHIGLHDFILVPLAASISHQLVELLGKQYVEAQKELARKRQLALVTDTLSLPLEDWLIAWPTTGGSDFGRLQTALRRIPQAVQSLKEIVLHTPQRPRTAEQPARIEA